LRILTLVTDAFGGNGGIALYNRDLLTALCSRPYLREVVAIPRIMPNPCEPIPDKLIYVTKGLNGKIRYIWTVLQTIKKKQFDLIICGHINLLPIAFLLSCRLRVPILLEIYGIEAWVKTRSPLVNYLAKKIDFFVSISELTKERFLKWVNLPDHKGFLLPNAIHTEHYGHGPKSLALLNRYGLMNKIVLITLGRLVSQYRHKGFDEVLESLPELKKKISNIAYLVVGDGPDRKRLEEKAKRLGVVDYVVFSGYIPEEEKADHFRLADVYIMPSRGEGFGFVFLEALACGVPVIGSKADGSREALCGGEMGILVDPSNHKDIENGILTALRHPKGIIPEKLENFSFKNFTIRLNNIIQEINRT